MKKQLSLIILSLFLLSIAIFAHEEDKNCEIDLEKYVNEVKEFVNNNPNDPNLQYAKELLGSNAKVELNIGNEVWHGELSNSKLLEVKKGKVKAPDFTVYASMCIIHDLEEGKISLIDALKDKKITYKANGLLNKLKLLFISIFLK